MYKSSKMECCNKNIGIKVKVKKAIVTQVQEK